MLWVKGLERDLTKNFINSFPSHFQNSYYLTRAGCFQKVEKNKRPFLFNVFLFSCTQFVYCSLDGQLTRKKYIKFNLKTALEVRTTHFGKKGQKTLYVEKRYETTTMLSKLCKKWPQTLQKMASTAHPFSLVSLRVEPNKFGLEGFRPSKVLMINGLIPFS